MWKDYYADKKIAREYFVESLFKFKFDRVLRSIEIMQKKSLLIDAVFEWQIIEDLRPKYEVEIRRYENVIKQLLTKIAGTAIGKILLNSLNQNEMIWIVPFFDVHYLAKTDRFTTEQGGGIRILYNPDDFKSVYVNPKFSYNAKDEILFHELVHASRFSNGNTSGANFSERNLDTSEEEFIATQLANIYQSSKGKRRYYGMSHDGGYGSKEEIYKLMAQNNQIVRIIKKLLVTEPLAKAAATLKSPEYNPFRDVLQIEAESKKFFIDL